MKAEIVYDECLTKAHITTVVIPDGITSIDYKQFAGYCSITSITIPDSVTSIDSSAFENCENLISITIPSSVTSIGHSAFAGCTSLTSIIFEDTSTWYIADRYSDWNNMTGGTSISVTDASTNAIYFTSTYTYDYWYKK